MSIFTPEFPFQPAGDQPGAIANLLAGLERGARFQTLEGVTGSGKTFTVANVIAKWGRPALIISHNKTLAAQVYGELKSYFPDNAVEYFVSYYDYYQPEAYIPQTDTYIEKDASINEEIEMLRLSATNSLMNRGDVIIVASVSCIYGLGSPEDYREMLVEARTGQELDRDAMLRALVDIQYSRNDYAAEPGTFRVRGDTVDVFPSYDRNGIRIIFNGDIVGSLAIFDPATGKKACETDNILISPARHFVMPPNRVEAAIDRITRELDERLAWFEANGRLLEAQRLKSRTLYDVEMMKETGYCAGIENYSRHLSGRAAGEPPATLLDYMPDDFLTIVDESHATLPQLRGMYNGDQARKKTLVEHGFRLPSAMDNRPLNFEEFLAAAKTIVFCSATPSEFELKNSPEPARQVVRPTGLVDPEILLRPAADRVDDLMEEIRARATKGERTLVTTLTKRSAEDLSEYLRSAGLRVKYLHSDIDALERIEILRGLRMADFDCLVGVNLLREGLDLPEVSLVAILDADKEGFLRSETSLIQTAGRAARNAAGAVIFYADATTDSMRRAMQLSSERRRRQMEYNRLHKITPRTVKKAMQESLSSRRKNGETAANIVRESGADYDVVEEILRLEGEMLEAADRLEFERAAMLRDRIAELKGGQSGPKPGGVFAGGPYGKPAKARRGQRGDESRTLESPEAPRAETRSGNRPPEKHAQKSVSSRNNKKLFKKRRP